MVSYALPRDFPNAVLPASSSVCTRPDGSQVVGRKCGNPTAFPRPLVARIDRDNGEGPGQLRSFSYDYYDGRTFAGQPSQRADFGFEFVTRTDLQLGVSEKTNYVQAKPYHRLVKSVDITDATGAHLRTRSLAYCCSDAPRSAQPNFVGLASETSTVFEQGTALTTSQTSYIWHASDPGFPVDVKLWETRNSTLRSAAPNAPGESDWDVVTDYYYDPDDQANWIVGKPNGILRYRDDRISGRVVLGASRTTYDVSHPLHAIPSQKLPLASSSLSCSNFGAQPGGIADTCSDCVDSRTTYWVTSFQKPVYDSFGHLTHWEGVRTPSSAHTATVTYDPLYSGLVASITNPLGQSTLQNYDAALRPSTMVDQNSHSTMISYDVYGRRTAVAAPATSAPHVAEFSYVGLASDPGNICRPSPCYLTTATDFSQSGRSHSVDSYRDGFGMSIPIEK